MTVFWKFVCQNQRIGTLWRGRALMPLWTRQWFVCEMKNWDPYGLCPRSIRQRSTLFLSQDFINWQAPLNLQNLAFWYLGSTDPPSLNCLCTQCSLTQWDINYLNYTWAGKNNRIDFEVSRFLCFEVVHQLIDCAAQLISMRLYGE